MRIFKELFEMHAELRRELIHNGLLVHVETVQDKKVKEDKNYLTKELIGYSFLVKNSDNRDEWIKSLDCNLDWCKEEFAERVSIHEINPGKAWKLRRKIWQEFIHDDKFSYSYNERLREQLNKTIDLLNSNPRSRQAIITVYDQHLDKDNRAGQKRIPCSMYYQFFIREGKLQLIYNIRSNDFVNHFPYDVWLATELQKYVADHNKHVAGQVGDFIYFCGSLHVFFHDAKEIF
jgi:thymidylate synthase